MLGRIVEELAQPGVAEATLIEAGELALLARLEAAADSAGDAAWRACRLHRPALAGGGR